MKINTLKELQNFTKSNEAVLIYFSSPSCGVCSVLKPKIFKEAKNRYPKLKQTEVDISLSLEIATNYNVLTAPTVLILLQNREFIRKTRTFGVDELLDELQRPYDILFQK